MKTAQCGRATDLKQNHDLLLFHNYRKVSNIRHTSLGNKIVDHTDVVGTSPFGAAPTTSSFLT